MGRQMFVLITSFLLIKEYGVSAQYATVLDCLPQGTATIARPIIQSAGQYILPIIQPIIPGYDSCAPDPYGPNYGNYPAPYPGYPPIIVKENDDFLRSLLYYLIFSMVKKDNNAPCNGNCYGSGQCQNCNSCRYCNRNNAQNTSSDTGSASGSGSAGSTGSTSDNTSTAPIYIPVPIAIPVYTSPDGYRYIDGFCDDILIQEPCDCYARDNEINLIIRTD